VARLARAANCAAKTTEKPGENSARKPFGARKTKNHRPKSGVAIGTGALAASKGGRECAVSSPLCLEGFLRLFCGWKSG
jgi:hypothetical protein